MLAGCVTDPQVREVVKISMACERLAARVAEPELKIGDDAKAKMFEHRVALGTANARLDATRECQKRQRNKFAKG